MLPNYYTFPAIFISEENGISISFPDLPGCFPCGSNEIEAISNAQEAMGLHLFGMEQDHEIIPEATPIAELKQPKHSAIILVTTFMPSIRDTAMNKSIKKTLTIPAWLNYKAERANVNFSKILQDGLIAYLGINQ